VGIAHALPAGRGGLLPLCDRNSILTTPVNH
jgi:hypothetical protein